MDAHSGERLYYHFVQSERIVEYEMALDTLESFGYKVQAVVVDGRPGARAICKERSLPVQMCHFHQAKIATKYLTKHPRLEANRELRSLSLNLHDTTRAELTKKLSAWHQKWDVWLRERYIDDSGRTRYTRSRTRSAYSSLKRNLDDLFTYQDYPELSIPHTTNMLDGWFGEMKRRLRSHNGLSTTHRNSIIRVLLRGRTD
jgi:hypothetical protein